MQTLAKVMAKLANAAGLQGRHTNHSLHATAATHLYDQNVNKHRISKLTGHHSVAVHNYQQVSLAKEKEMLDVLYGKKPKRNVSATVTSSDLKEEPNFDVGTLTQLQTLKETIVKPP